MKAEYVLWFTVLSLMFAVGMLGYRANQRHGLGPLAIGLFAATFIMFGKFYLKEDYLSYAGIFLLIAASIWNAWPRKGASGMTGIHLEPYDENKHRLNRR